MREFYEFDEQQHPKKNNFITYIAIALIFTMLGGIAMYAVFPYLLYQDNSIVLNPDPLEDSDKQPDDNQSLPVLGYIGDLFISGDNPVVDIAAKVSPAVVGITSTTMVVVPDFFQRSIQREVEGYGSGIIISEDGHIVTNYHVVKDTKKLFVILKGGEKVEAELVGIDPQSDVAVVKIDVPNLTVAKLGDSDKVRQGELAVAIGNPLGHNLAGTVTVGVISAIDRTLQVEGTTLKLLQTDAAINQGNSGGALVNTKGEIIGMNTAKLAGNVVEGLGFAIPSNVFVPIAQEIIHTGKVVGPEKPWIGVIEPFEITQGISDEYGYPLGILVRDVYPGSPAELGGIKPGDVILSFDNQDTPTIDKLRTAIDQRKVGDIVDIKLWRNGTDFVLRIKLGNMNDIE